MKVRFGVKGSPAPVEIDLDGEKKQDAVQKQVEAAMAKDGEMLWLTDKSGKTLGIPGSKISYVEIGSPTEDRKVGFTTGA